jgi:radical SAM superfamily enzyme YgiQ (UPF0313 family)
MKIILVNPPYINFEGMKESGGHTMPFNLAYLAGYLRSKVACEIKILDTEAMSMGYAEIKNFIADERPDIIGFTCLSPTVNHVFNICRIVKEELKLSCITVIGGTHPTILPREVLANPYVDIAVVGEGEITFSELVQTIKDGAADFEKIDGLYFKRNGKIIGTKSRRMIDNLDDIPFPARDLFNLKLYKSAPTKKLTDEQCSPLQTSRGCAFNCIHCVSKSIWNRRLRYRSAKNIIAEIEECINKFNIKEFNVLDDNFTLNKKRAIEVCQEIIDKKLPIAWICFSRADTIDDELAGFMVKAGCKKISLGLESGSQEMLDLMRKQTTVEKGREAVKIIRRNGMMVHASFMLGNINETKETILETIAFAKSLDLDNATFFITCPVPGSDLYYYAKDNGFIANNTPWEMFAPLSDTPPLLVQKNLTQEELVYWQKRAFREFYLRPKYIIKKLQQINSWDAIKTVFEGLRILWRVLFKPKPKKSLNK